MARAAVLLLGLPSALYPSSLWACPALSGKAECIVDFLVPERLASADLAGLMVGYPCIPSLEGVRCV